MHHSPEQPQRAQKQRPELNLDTSPAVSRSREVAPDSVSVPVRKYALSTAKGKPPPVSSRGFRLPASGSATASKRNSEDSFLENDSPIDAERAELDYRQGRPPRDSHDLSLPSQKFTRDSLLGNMLNSLDQFSLTQINTPIGTTFEDDGDPYGVPRGDAYTRSMTNASRRPTNLYTPGSAHGHGYSYSSDFEGFDDAASRTSQHSRGRRSNSGSGYQSGLPRINSMRERSHPGTPGRRPLHSRGGKTSKSSSLNSFDMAGGRYAQGLPSRQWGHAAGGRSSSFDYGQRPSLSAPGPWDTEFSNTFLVDDYEIAPNPTVPGGPRAPLAPASPAMIPSAPPSEYEPKTPDRRKEARSRSGTNKTTQSSKYTAAREAAPPLPPLDVDSAPAPHVGYGKAKEAQPAIPVSAPPIKEKQGFFSRLFGSSRSTPSPSPAVEPFAAPAPPVAAEPPPSGTNKVDRVLSHSKPLSAPPTRDSEVPRQTPHVVQKKSSFFRRRKKSITEPPVPPLPTPNPIDISKPTDSLEPGTTDPSPVSSLRQVMNPYLKGSNPVTPQDMQTPRRDGTNPTSEIDARAEHNRQSRGFSPEYDPSPNATIRTVKSTSALKSQESRWRSQLDSPIRSPPSVPNDLVENAESTTFFHDSSDEGEKGQVGGRKQRQRAQTGKASSSKTNPMPRTTHTSAGERNLAESDLSQRRPSPNLPLQKSPVDEDRVLDSLEVPLGIPRKSSSRPTLSRSASSVPSVTVDSSQASPRIPDGPLDEPEVSIGEPTEDDRQKARGIFDGDEDFIQKEKAAAWMGEEGPIRQRTLRAYMDLYNFENHSVLAALRQVCVRLVFRAETQQVDRILVAFSNRWCDCNPNHGFKTIDVIHTMCYSIMLLNTDLHIADIEQKMTRNQFIKNTMSTITQALLDSAPETLNRSSILQPKNALLSPAESDSSKTTAGEHDKSSWRASFSPLQRTESSMGFGADSGTDTCGPLVKAPFDGPIRAWEGQMEIVLKDVYTSIRDEKLPLFGADAGYQQPQPQGGLAVMGRLKRSPSVLSKAPSEGQASLRGRINEATRTQGGRWTSKSRSRPRLGNGFSSSRTSFDDGHSIWSPSPSSATWSRNSLGRTQTSMSIDSFASGYPNSDYQQSIGFANALSQAITRDDYTVGASSQSIMSEEFQTTQLLDDESLELIGPPWVKEGIVMHKHHLDGVDKKAKDRNWNEVFAVVQKGSMSLFSFSTKSMRQKARTGRKPAVGAVVGGGNWQENATSLGCFSLRQTLASALPPPGYSRTRPNVWALSLPSGAVHLFQVGTPEISKEFVLTVNYWSARLSTHPLVGGISNIEYGWSDAVINNALIGSLEEPPIPQRPGSAAAGRTSMHSRQGSRQSSIRSSFDVGGNVRTKLPGDRIHIAEWAPPSQSLRPSQCSESEQLEALLTYVKSVEDELQQHNQLRSPMLLAFTPRGHNAAKAMANWERKSSHLLREIVKFRTYVDSLQHATERRNEIYTERENARRAARGEDIDDSSSAHSDEADMTLKPE